jgi:hypothetical protein
MFCSLFVAHAATRFGSALQALWSRKSEGMLLGQNHVLKYVLFDFEFGKESNEEGSHMYVRTERITGEGIAQG